MTFPAAILLLAGSLRALPPKLPEFKPLDFKPPQGARVALANGMILYLLEDHELPVIQGSALVRTGTIRDPSGKTGLAALVGRTMRSAGSKRFPADAMNETLESLGASVETGMGQESGSAGFWCLAKDLDQVLEIFADVLMHPAFETEKVEVERQKMLEEVRRRNDDPRQIARREAPRMLYGPDHPYGRRTEEATIKAVSIGDLRAFHERFLVPGGVSLALSGDFRSAELGEKVREAFQAWPARAPEPPAFPEVAAVNERRVFLVPKEVTQAGTPTTTRYLYDNEDILLELDGANTVQARYTHGPGLMSPSSCSGAPRRSSTTLMAWGASGTSPTPPAPSLAPTPTTASAISSPSRARWRTPTRTRGGRSMRRQGSTITAPVIMIQWLGVLW